MIKIQKGFTLIELLVVIAIIGILAGVLFVTIDPAARINDAKLSVAKTDLAGVPIPIILNYTANDYTYTKTCEDVVDGGIALVVSVIAVHAGHCTQNAEKTNWAIDVAENSVNYCLDSISRIIKTGSVGALGVCL